MGSLFTLHSLSSFAIRLLPALLYIPFIFHYRSLHVGWLLSLSTFICLSVAAFTDAGLLFTPVPVLECRELKWLKVVGNVDEQRSRKAAALLERLLLRVSDLHPANVPKSHSAGLKINLRANQKLKVWSSLFREKRLNANRIQRQTGWI